MTYMLTLITARPSRQVWLWTQVVRPEGKLCACSCTSNHTRDLQQLTDLQGWSSINANHLSSAFPRSFATESTSLLSVVTTHDIELYIKGNGWGLETWYISQRTLPPAFRSLLLASFQIHKETKDLMFRTNPLIMSVFTVNDLFRTGESWLAPLFTTLILEVRVLTREAVKLCHFSDLCCLDCTTN